MEYAVKKKHNIFFQKYIFEKYPEIDWASYVGGLTLKKHDVYTLTKIHRYDLQR